MPQTLRVVHTLCEYLVSPEIEIPNDSGLVPPLDEIVKNVKLVQELWHEFLMVGTQISDMQEKGAFIKLLHVFTTCDATDVPDVNAMTLKFANTFLEYVTPESAVQKLEQGHSQGAGPRYDNKRAPVLAKIHKLFKSLNLFISIERVECNSMICFLLTALIILSVCIVITTKKYSFTNYDGVKNIIDEITIRGSDEKNRLKSIKPDVWQGALEHKFKYPNAMASRAYVLGILDETMRQIVGSGNTVSINLNNLLASSNFEFLVQLKKAPPEKSITVFTLENIQLFFLMHFCKFERFSCDELQQTAPHLYHGFSSATTKGNFTLYLKFMHEQLELAIQEQARRLPAVCDKTMELLKVLDERSVLTPEFPAFLKVHPGDYLQSSLALKLVLVPYQEDVIRKSNEAIELFENLSLGTGSLSYFAREAIRFLEYIEKYIAKEATSHTPNNWVKDDIKISNTKAGYFDQYEQMIDKLENISVHNLTNMASYIHEKESGKWVHALTSKFEIIEDVVWPPEDQMPLQSVDDLSISRMFEFVGDSLFHFPIPRQFLERTRHNYGQTNKYVMVKVLVLGEHRSDVPPLPNNYDKAMENGMEMWQDIGKGDFGNAWEHGKGFVHDLAHASLDAYKTQVHNVEHETLPFGVSELHDFFYDRPKQKFTTPLQRTEPSPALEGTEPSSALQQVNRKIERNILNTRFEILMKEDHVLKTLRDLKIFLDYQEHSADIDDNSLDVYGSTVNQYALVPASGLEVETLQVETKVVHFSLIDDESFDEKYSTWPSKVWQLELSPEDEDNLRAGNVVAKHINVRFLKSFIPLWQTVSVNTSQGTLHLSVSPVQYDYENSIEDYTDMAKKFMHWLLYDAVRPGPHIKSIISGIQVMIRKFKDYVSSTYCLSVGASAVFSIVGAVYNLASVSLLRLLFNVFNMIFGAYNLSTLLTQTEEEVYSYVDLVSALVVFFSFFTKDVLGSAYCMGSQKFEIKEFHVRDLTRNIRETLIMELEFADIHNNARLRDLRKSKEDIATDAITLSRIVMIRVLLFIQESNEERISRTRELVLHPISPSTTKKMPLEFEEEMAQIKSLLSRYKRENIDFHNVLGRIDSSLWYLSQLENADAKAWFQKSVNMHNFMSEFETTCQGMHFTGNFSKLNMIHSLCKLVCLNILIQFQKIFVCNVLELVFTPEHASESGQFLKFVHGKKTMEEQWFMMSLASWGKIIGSSDVPFRLHPDQLSLLQNSKVVTMDKVIFAIGVMQTLDFLFVASVFIPGINKTTVIKSLMSTMVDMGEANWTHFDTLRKQYRKSRPQITWRTQLAPVQTPSNEELWVKTLFVDILRHNIPIKNNKFVTTLTRFCELTHSDANSIRRLWNEIDAARREGVKISPVLTNFVQKCQGDKNVNIQKLSTFNEITTLLSEHDKQATTLFAHDLFNILGCTVPWMNKLVDLYRQNCRI